MSARPRISAYRRWCDRASELIAVPLGWIILGGLTLTLAALVIRLTDWAWHSGS